MICGCDKCLFFLFYSMAGSALVPNNSPVDVATIGAHFPIFNRLIVFHGRKRFKITLRLFLLRYIYATHFASVNVLTLIAWLVKIKIFSCVYFNNVCTPQTHTPHCIQYPVINNCRHFRQNSLGICETRYYISHLRSIAVTMTEMCG